MSTPRPRRGREPADRHLTRLGPSPTGANHWVDGWFYNPEDGKAYSVTAQLKSDDVIVARIYVGVPLFGKTKTLARVRHGTTEGWC